MHEDIFNPSVVFIRCMQNLLHKHIWLVFAEAAKSIKVYMAACGT